MEAINLSWRKSSYSGNGGGNCVEVGTGPAGTVAVRDSKNLDGPVLPIEGNRWRGFIAEVKAGRHDLA